MDLVPGVRRPDRCALGFLRGVRRSRRGRPSPDVRAFAGIGSLVGEAIGEDVLLAAHMPQRESPEPLGALDGLRKKRFQMGGLHSEVTVDLLDQQTAVGEDLDVVGAELLGPSKRKKKRPVLCYVVGRRSQRLEVLFGGAGSLGFDVGAGSGGSGVISRRAV